MNVLWFSVLTLLVTFVALFPEDARIMTELAEGWIKHIPTAIRYQVMKQTLWWQIQGDRFYFRYRLWRIRNRHNHNETNQDKQG